MFGECLGVWLLHEWSRMAPPGTPTNLVELGPGRGTLAADVLRTVAKLAPERIRDVSLHLVRLDIGNTWLTIMLTEVMIQVEVSDLMRRLQEVTICGRRRTTRDEEVMTSRPGGVPVSWHHDLASVPRGAFSLFLANEFFDALPIHQFIKCSKEGDEGWREILVDLDPAMGGQALRLVRSRGRTPNVVHIKQVCRI